MKIRNGHVTNSSSTSYLVAIAKEVPSVNAPFAKKALDTLLSILHDGIKLSTIEELNKYFLEDWLDTEDSIEKVLEDYEDSYDTEYYHNIREHIEEGKTVYICSLDYHEDVGNEAILNLFTNEAWVYVKSLG